MFCTECGKENQDGSMQCSSCGHLFVKDEIVMNIEMENSDEYSDAVN